MVHVLDGPSTFQAEAASIQKLLRRYLELMEEQDRDAGVEPRVQLYTHHRIIEDEGDGWFDAGDGRKGIRIEPLREFDFKGKFVRVRQPDGALIDLGTPELFMIAEGSSSSDARHLGFEQHDVEVDHGDGRGTVVAQADFLAGLVEVLVGGRLRRRISSEFDGDGQEYWVRQIAVGHENDPEVGWVLVQVPDFKTFDPIESAVVPDGTDPDSPEFYAAFQELLYDYYVRQAADILEIPRDELRQVQMIYGPKLFSLVERVGEDALVAANGVVAGDSFGNGHFLTSGGAMTGMIGHSSRVLQYWRDRDSGSDAATAIRRLADSIEEDTHAWLQVSAKEYSQAVPINFGAERIEQIAKQGGVDATARAQAIDAARRQRHGLIPLNPSDWRRLFVHNGKVISELPELPDNHPLQRPERRATMLAVLESLPGVPSHAATRLMRSEVATTKSTRAIGTLAPKEPQIYAFLDILDPSGHVAERLALDEEEVVIGRDDADRGVVPDVDLTSFDSERAVSREHARIRADNGGYSIEDLDSRNGTELAGSALSPFQAHTLDDGDVITFGSVQATFRLAGGAELPVAWSVS